MERENNILFVLTITILHFLWESCAEDVCKYTGCAGSQVPSGSPVLKLCHDLQNEGLNITFFGRCCIEKRNTTHNFVVGLDLSGCNISSFDILQHEHESEMGIYERKELQVLALENNPVEHAENCSDADFIDIVNLEFLTMPSMCSCPGGNDSWTNMTTVHDVTQCYGCLNKCDNTSTWNITCPENSHCVMHMPGEQWCTCKEGYYGYKCLRTGSFSAGAFGVIVSIVTVVLAGFGGCVLRKGIKYNEPS